MLHPSWLITAAGQIPPVSQSSKWRPHSKSSGERMAQQWRAEEKLKIESMRLEPTSPTNVLEIMWQVTPPPGFWGVMACLQRDWLLVDVHEAPLGPLSMAAIVEPTVATMSTSCIVKDEVTGITNMDTLTIYVGWVALSGPSQGMLAMRPIIEDITVLPWRTSPCSYWWSLVGWVHILCLYVNFRQIVDV